MNIDHMDKQDKVDFFLSKQFKALGTDVDLRIVFESLEKKEKAENDLLEAFAIYAKTEKIFSRFDQESELSVLNNNLAKWMPVSAEMLEVVSRAVSHHEMTEGYFDPRIIVPLENQGYVLDFSKNDFSKKTFDESSVDFSKKFADDIKIDFENEKIWLEKRIDLSGIVKGFVSDRVANFFFQQGWKNFYVDSGGDMFFAGRDENCAPWLADVEGVSNKKIIIDVSDRAVATSGIGKRKWEVDGKRFHHLINPKNPEAASFDLKSVSVVADSVEKADVWAKTIFLMGKEKALAWSEKNNVPFLMLYYNGNVFISK